MQNVYERNMESPVTPRKKVSGW